MHKTNVLPKKSFYVICMQSILVFTSLYLTLPAHSNVYRCALPDGKSIYQEVPCNIRPDAQEKATDWSKEREKVAAAKVKLEADRKTQEADRKARRLKEAQLNPSPKSAGVVDCIDLYNYAKARGSGWMEATAVVQEAERTGTCVKKK